MSKKRVQKTKLNQNHKLILIILSFIVILGILLFVKGNLTGYALAPGEICVDSDNGLNEFVKAGIEWESEAKIKSKKDRCLDETTVEEWYCAVNGLGRNKKITCQNGYVCSDGICVEKQDDTCTDNEVGKSQYSVGTVTLGNGETYKDACENGQLREYYCENGLKSDLLNCDTEEVCSNGECVEAYVQGSGNYFLEKGDSISVYGKTLKLENVGSSGAIVVNVDGVQETITFNTKEPVNGLMIINAQPVFSEGSAVLAIIEDNPETFTMKVGEVITIDASYYGTTKYLTLVNVGSAGAIVVDVDGVQETLISEPEIVEGISITNINTVYNDDITRRWAVIKIPLPESTGYCGDKICNTGEGCEWDGGTGNIDCSTGEALDTNQYYCSNCVKNQLEETTAECGNQICESGEGCEWDGNVETPGNIDCSTGGALDTNNYFCSSCKKEVLGTQTSECGNQICESGEGCEWDGGTGNIDCSTGEALDTSTYFCGSCQKSELTIGKEGCGDGICESSLIITGVGDQNTYKGYLLIVDSISSSDRVEGRIDGGTFSITPGSHQDVGNINIRLDSVSRTLFFFNPKATLTVGETKNNCPEDCDLTACEANEESCGTVCCPRGYTCTDPTKGICSGTGAYEDPCADIPEGTCCLQVIERDGQLRVSSNFKCDPYKGNQNPTAGSCYAQPDPSIGYINGISGCTCCNDQQSCSNTPTSFECKAQ